MITSFTIAGLTFHLYGLIVGLAVVIGILLTEHRLHLEAKRHALPFSLGQWWQVVTVVLIGGLVGARVWHVITDWGWYQSHLEQVWWLWQGGLSILGAVAGGTFSLMITVAWWRRRKLVSTKYSVAYYIKYISDVAVFGLPIGQAIGRWGNFINQELYGLPTNLPWGIYIDPSARTAQFAQQSYYHPLFAYEMAVTALFGVTIWWLLKFRPHLVPKLGTGQLSTYYLLYYSLVRFGLDFLRVDKSIWWKTGLGVNQVVLLAIIVVILGKYGWQWVQQRVHA